MRTTLGNTRLTTARTAAVVAAVAAEAVAGALGHHVETLAGAIDSLRAALLR